MILTVVSAIPAKRLEWLRRIVCSLAASVGDVTAVVTGGDSEMAIRAALRTSIDSLCAVIGDAAVVLVAHSHGAALIHRLMRADPPAALARRRVTLLSYGSAIVPVHVLEHHHRNRRTWLSRFVVVLGLVALLTLAFQLVRIVVGASPLMWLWVVVLVGLSVALAIGYLDSGRFEVLSTADGDANHARDCFTPALPPSPGGMRWVDLWGVWDPVPNGPLHVREQRAIAGRDRRYRSVRPVWATDGEVRPVPYLVANVHQPWLDHTTYAHNEDEFVSRLALEVAAAGRPDSSVEQLARWQHRDGGAADADAQDDVVNGAADAARRSRQVRGWWLLGAQLATVVGAIAMLVRHQERLRRLGSWLAALLPDAGRSWFADRIDWVPMGVRDVALGADRDPFVLYGASVFIVALLLLLLAEWLIIRVAQRRASSAYANHRARASQRLDRTDAAAFAAALILTLVPVIIGIVVQWADLGVR